MAEPTVSAPRPALGEGGVVADDGWGAPPETTDRREVPPVPVEPMFTDEDLATLEDEAAAGGQGRLAVVLGVTVAGGLVLGLGLILAAAGAWFLLA